MLKFQQTGRYKILLVQITNKNFGDSVIADNTRALLRKAFPYHLRERYDILDYSIQTEDLAQVSYVDAIVFAGGGLVKFRQENLYRQVSELIMEAQKCQIPVFLNAVGVEGYDAEDERCRMLVEALNQPCVKAISVRDDVECLTQYYLRESKARVKAVFDPAVWSEKTYHIPEKKRKNQKCIGLGIARDTLFADYGIPSVEREFMRNLWIDIVDLLEKRGYDWKIFTNGLDQDEKFAQDILVEIGHGEKCEQPINAKALVDEIAEMDGLIACRMHSNIIAYSLGIPSIGLVWNAKMVMWGEKCGYAERYLPYTELKASRVVDALEDALKENTRKPSWTKKYSTYWEIRHFVRKYCKPREREKISLNPQRHMAAAALGGCDFKYKNMNTLPQMWDSLKRGYRILELDVRFSADEQLVCVNGWKEGTKRALGDSETDGEMDVEEFSRSKYYHYFPTCTFEGFIQEFSTLPEKYKGIRLILDVGKPKTALLDAFYGQLTDVLRKYHIPEQNIIVRMQRERDITAFERQNYFCRMSYFISQETAETGTESEQFEKIVRFCKKKKIRIISMTEKTWTIELQESLSRQKFKVMVLSYTKAGDIIEAMQGGAEFAASHYYGVDYVNKLLS